MKTSLIGIAVVIMTVFVGYKAATAQGLKDELLYAYRDPKEKGKVAKIYDMRGNTSLNPSARKHFQKRHGDYTSLNWFVYETGIIARFEAKGLNHMSLYDNHGVWKHTVTYYPYNKIDQEAMKTVQSKYPDFDILRAFEIRASYAGPKFIVQIENTSEMRELVLSGKKLTLHKTVSYIK